MESPKTNTDRQRAASSSTARDSSPYQSGQRVACMSRHCVPWPGRRGPRTAKPSAARCSPQGRMLWGVPVKPCESTIPIPGSPSGSAEKGSAPGITGTRASSTRGSRTPDGRASGLIVARPTRVRYGQVPEQVVDVDTLFSEGRRRGVVVAASERLPTLRHPGSRASVGREHGALLVHEVGAPRAAACALRSAPRCAARRTCPARAAPSWRPTTSRSSTPSCCPSWSPGGWPSRPRPSTSRRRAWSAPCSAGSSPAWATSRSSAATGAPPARRSTPASACCARAGCSGSTPRARARPTAGCTRAAPGWPAWRWRRRSPSCRSRWWAPTAPTPSAPASGAPSRSGS